MKKLYLFLFASLLSMSMFAIEYSGNTKAQAIPYNWGTGIHVSSEAGVGKWYVVMLRQDQTDYEKPTHDGPFNPQGKTVDGSLTNINVSVVNPLDQEADIDVVAYIGNNETTRHFKLGPGGIKSMTFGAGAFVTMGIDRVFLYLVMDVTITPEEAEQHEAVNVNVTPVENENTVVFTPIDFNWTNWPNKTAATVIPANTETWVKFDFVTYPALEGKTYKFYIEKDGNVPTTVHAGMSYDCPATSIQSEDKVITSSTSRVLDAAKLSILPGTLYARLKADQDIRLHAELVDIPAPEPGTPVIFNINDAQEVLLWDADHQENEYTLTAGNLVYSVDYATLQADENHYRQIEVTNNGSEEVTIVGQASKAYETGTGNVYSAVSKTVTIPAGQTYVKKIDKTMQAVVGAAAGDKIYALGPEFPNVTFKLTEQPNDPDYCRNAQDFEWGVFNEQDADYAWYAVSIADAKDKKADIVLTMETEDGSEANITVDLATACELGAPTQSYTGKSKSTVKTLSYSLYEKNANSDMYVRVRTDKKIKVKAELLTTKTWDGSQWSGEGHTAPTIDESARIEGDLTIHANETVKALGITLANKDIKVTIENGGKLIVGEEGIKGSENVNQIFVEDGGILLIDPAAKSNNKPFATVEKKIVLGPQTHAQATLPELHDFISLPIDNREAGVGYPMYYANWDRMNGWVATDGFRRAFAGYNVFSLNGESVPTEQLIAFKGQLVSNQNVTLNLPLNGWYSFGNSWTAPIALSSIYSQLSGVDDAAVHFYVASPTDYSSVGLGLIKDNYYIPATQEIASNLSIDKIKPMQGFFLHTESSYSVTLNYNELFNSNVAAPAPKRAVADNRTMAAVVLSNGTACDFVYLIEGEAGNASKMNGNEFGIFAQEGLAQVASDNLIGTVLTIKTGEESEYMLHFTWLNGETMYLRDLANGNIIAMTADSRYTFTAEPNTVGERFQVVGRYNTPTGIENNAVIEGANKFIENGKLVIIKNGVKYNAQGAKL